MNKEEESRFYKPFLTGCLCEDVSWLLTQVHQIVNNIMINEAILFNSSTSDELIRNKISDDYLCNCSYLRIAFRVFREQVKAKNVCSGLFEIVADFTKNFKCKIADILVSGMFCDCPFMSHASMKTFVDLLISANLHFGCSKFSGFYIELFKRFQMSLSSIDNHILSLLSAFEHLLIALKSSETNPKSNSFDVCNNKVDQIEINTAAFSYDAIFETFDVMVSFPTLVSKLNISNCEIGTQTLLRVLLIGIEKSEHLKNMLLKNYQSIFIIMQCTTTLLVFERCCIILKEIIDYKAIVVVKDFEDEGQGDLAEHFLQTFTSFKLVNSLINLKTGDSFHGFGGPFIRKDSPPLDHLSTGIPCFRSFLLLYLASLSTKVISNDCSEQFTDEIIAYLCNVNQFCMSKIQDEKNFLSLFDDQDDQLLEVMMYCLEIYKFIHHRNGSLTITKCHFAHPLLLFYNFLQMIGMDYQVLLDFLISEETCFLFYFLSYLKFTLNNVDELNKFLPQVNHQSNTDVESTSKLRISHVLVNYEDTSSDEESTENQQTKSCDKSVMLFQETLVILKNLTSAIEKQVRHKLFPYNALPLLKLLRRFNYSDKYE